MRACATPAVLAVLALMLPVAPAHAQLFDWLKRDKDRGGQDIWSIRCITISGADGARVARAYAEALRKAPGFKPELVRVFGDASGGSVYYGEFRRRYDRRSKSETFSPDPVPVLNELRRLTLGGQDIWPFELATLAALPAGADPEAKWLLREAPGHWSLQVAVFYNDGEFQERRRAAEEYCKLLRDQGEEAYVDHGDVHSIVALGAFPREAIQTFQRRNPLTGILEVSERIVDGRMLELQKKFPHNLHNGATFYEVSRNPRTGRRVREPHTSFVVRIPRATAGSLTGG